MFETLPAGTMRHPDHRFEGSRVEFRHWVENVAAAHGYELRIEGIGTEDAAHGCPTQMGVFTRRTSIPEFALVLLVSASGTGKSSFAARQPVRYDWAADYKGSAKIVYGHTPVVDASWVNGTLCIDTSCVFGGKLTALRFPEMDLVEVVARATYYEPIRPLGGPPAATGEAHPGQLKLADVLGRQAIETRDLGIVVVPEANAAAALEVVSRDAVDPRWLIHLPPTMSPDETSAMDG